MNMNGRLRVRTDQRYRTLYNDLKNIAFSEMHEIFFLCAVLGFQAQKQRDLGKNAQERFWSSTITPDEWACYYAIMIETHNMDFSYIQDDQNVIACMEEYANAGMEILLEDILSQYIIYKSDEPKIDVSISKELPKLLLSFIYSKLPDISLR